MKSKTVTLLIRYFVGALFIFSGFAKLIDVEPFELILVQNTFVNWGAAPYISRVIIGFEIFIGLAFFQNQFRKRFFVPVALAVLTLFSIHLVATIIRTGSADNCGCFGGVIIMTPLEALIKNVILIFLLIFVYRRIEKVENPKLLLPVILLIVSYLLVFIVFPVKPYNPEQTAKAKVENPFSGFTEFNGKTVNLNEGEKIVALLSLDCEDCLETAGKLGELSKEFDLPPVYALFLGDSSQVEEFFSKAGTEFHYKVIEAQTFFPLVKDYPPRIVLLVNGIIKADLNYETFNSDDFKETIQSLRK